jgi:hypothetical protein
LTPIPLSGTEIHKIPISVGDLFFVLKCRHAERII